MITVREVKSGYIHATVKHLDKHVNIPARGSKNVSKILKVKFIPHGANDLSFSVLEVDSIENLVELHS